MSINIITVLFYKQNNKYRNKYILKLATLYIVLYIYSTYYKQHRRYNTFISTQYAAHLYVNINASTF